MSNSLSLANVNFNSPTKPMGGRYKNFNTKKLCDAILAITVGGKPYFELRSIKMKKSRKGEIGRGKQLIRIKTIKPFITVGGETLYPELVIVNSNDGSSQLEVMMGVFRLVCTNGMIVKTKDLGDFKIRHQGSEEDAAMELMKEFARHLPKWFKVQRQLEATILDDDTILELAAAACEYRFLKRFSKEDVAILVEACRPQDEGNDAWRVLNRIQEKIMKGGFKVGPMKRTAKTVKSVVQDLELNQMVYELIMAASGIEEVEYEMAD